LFGAAGSGPQHEGQGISPGALLQVNTAQRRITLTLPASALGHANLQGARLWLNTWDWDGGYRALNEQAQGHSFGHAGRPGPHWLDASPMLQLSP
jgi:hypothetical protein